MCVGAPAAAQRAHSPLRGALRCLLARRDRAGAARAQTFTPKAEKSGDKFTGSLAAKASVCPGADVELTLKTSGVVAANVEAANMFTSGLTLTLDCETPAPGKAGLLAIGKGTVDYKSDALTCKASYDYYKGEAHAAASSAFKALTFGASADYSVAKSALAKYAAACQFVQPDFTVVAKLDEAIGKADGMVYTASYYHKVSPKMQAPRRRHRRPPASVSPPPA